ncbi:MAG TPA: hypothetical protein VH540_21860 [Ktedonobacterales bacterium]|jgi:hypothetical protein
MWMRPKRSTSLLRILGTLALLNVVFLFLHADTSTHSSLPQITAPASARQSVPAAFGQVPISFEMNQGQTDSKVRFLAHAPGYSLFLTSTEALLAFSSKSHTEAASSDRFGPALRSPSPSVPTTPAAVVGMQFIGASPQPAVTGEQPLPGLVNYLLGNDPANWRTNIPTYAQVRYHNIYPGIDLVYYGNQGQLEYDFVVSPGSDASCSALPGQTT